MSKRKKAFTNYEINKNIAKILVLHRVWSGLNQTKVAKDLNVSFQQIQKYEKGTNGVSSSRLMQLSNFLKVPITYFYEDYADSQATTDSTVDSTEDLNYSFLIKTFGRLSENQKLKIIQILKNTGSLKETG